MNITPERIADIEIELCDLKQEVKMLHSKLLSLTELFKQMRNYNHQREMEAKNNAHNQHDAGRSQKR